MQHAGTREVVDELAGASEEAVVLRALDRLPDQRP
jgi:hypothetical protein